MGYHRAGFEVVGVDLHPQPNYPFRFVQCDWADFARLYGAETFDAIHASPPCQAFTRAQKLRHREHPDLIGDVRHWLKLTGLPYVIENVPGAPLESPIVLCGGMFGLPLYRHRMFEASFDLPMMLEPSHVAPQVKMGRKPRSGEVVQVVGHFSDVAAGREAMGIDWMTRDELSESIPPAYTEWIGRQLISASSSFVAPIAGKSV